MHPDQIEGIDEARKRKRDAEQDGRWFVVPKCTAPQPSMSADIVNRHGELVATFENFADAERAVEAVNGRT